MQSAAGKQQQAWDKGAANDLLGQNKSSEQSNEINLIIMNKLELIKKLRNQLVYFQIACNKLWKKQVKYLTIINL